MSIKDLSYRAYTFLPETLRNEIDIRRRAPTWRQHQCIFIHVPKSAGTSISHMVYGKTLGHFYATDIQRIAPKLWAHCFTFSVVRHPLNRLQSAYNFARQGGTPVMGIQSPEKYKGEVFSSFDRFVQEWLIHQDLANADLVFRPQHFFTSNSNGNLLVERCYKLEEFNEHLPELEERLGQPLPLKKMNMTELPTEAPSAQTIQLVKDIYKKDFAYFGY